jgi:hypothetical protein
MMSAFEPMRERFDLLQADLSRLRRELAEALVSGGKDRVCEVEDRIREVWDQIDGLAASLGEPHGKVAIPISA